MHLSNISKNGMWKGIHSSATTGGLCSHLGGEDLKAQAKAEKPVLPGAPSWLSKNNGKSIKS